MKLITVQYLGFTAMDRRFSGPMLPWIVSEIRKRDSYEQVCLGMEDGYLQAYNVDFELQWSHRVQQITRFSQLEPDPCQFLYLYRDDVERLLYCYLFQATRQSDVADLYQLMREQSGDKGTPQRSLSSAAQLVSLCADISPSSSHFFEVLYVGKIKISHRKVPESFIDDALDKFHAHESDKSAAAGQHVGAEILRRDSADSTASHESTLSLEPAAAVTPCESVTESSTDGTAGANHSKHVNEHNRTMVLQVGRNDLRLISPDRKLVLLHKQHRDVASCVQGLRDPDHFGFICRDHHHPQQQVTTPTSAASSTYIGYVFKCESASVASDAVNAVSQAFTNPETSAAGRAITEKQRPPLTSCDHCPMVWYHRLCAEVENLSDRKTQAAIFRRIDQLDEEEQATIVTKFKGVETDSMREQNEFLMMLLRAHCEMKQNRHVHDTAEQRSEFLHHYLGAGTGAGGITGGMGHGIFTKAKRSLSSSFDHLLKRKASRDDVGPATRSELSLPVTDTAVTPTSYRGISPEAPSNQGLRSPMMDMFMKVGSSGGSPRVSTSEDGSGPVEPHRTPGGSWRQAIFHRVSTARPADCSPARSEVTHTRTRAELRALWKRAIKQAVLLVRMERENARLRARQEETAVKRIKLEYDDLCPESYADTGELWDSLLGSQHQRCSERPQPDDRLLQQAVLGGVPRALRGELWQLLADRQALRHPPPAAAASHPNYAAPYSELLRQLTSHQHAILIDLGRTFPQHAYFAAPLGPGQLSLFNLLKAYSLLDPEVGYCQGLSFVAGVLLLHADEADAYRLLRHLMFSRGLRALYLPDMEALQVQLYQLSRMLLDRLPTLYAHLDVNDVSPTLYAAPWLLTMFASQFPLGFVARVLDLVFLEGSDVLLRVALALLAEHEEALLACDGFERIMEHLKGELPAAGPKSLDLAIRRACHQPDATARQLAEYRVEYHVLREEAAGAKVQAETVSRLETECATLRDQAAQLAQQLEMALGNVQRLERNRALQQSAHNRLEVQARALEVSVATLGAFIDQLVEDKVDVQIPGEVRRIVSQLSVAECRRRAGGAMNVASITPTAVAPRSHQMVKSLSTGRIATPAMNQDSEIQRCNSLTTHAELRSSALPSLRVLAEEERPTTVPTKPTSLGTKMSHFFSTSHSHILQNKLSGTGVKQVIREDSREGLLTPPPSAAPADGQPNFPVIVSSEPTEPTVSPAEPTEQATAPAETAADSPTSSIDSGVGTPISPKHPLSNCDVNFTFNGTTKLKNIRNMSRNLSRNSSPDLLGK